MSYRFRYYIHPEMKAYIEKNKKSAYVFACWHQNIVAGMLSQKNLTHTMMVSRSKDAEPVSFLLKKLGHRPVRGSSRGKGGVDKGGKDAKEEMIKMVKEGTPAAMAVDGPKGPAKVVKLGVIDIAKTSEVPVVALIPMPEKFKSFNSWDKFKFPLPFTKIVIYYGPPTFISSGSTKEENSVYKDVVAKELSSLEGQESDYLSQWSDLSKENPLDILIF